MESKLPPLALESGLDLRQITTTGSLLQINEDYDGEISVHSNEYENEPDPINAQCIGGPVKSFEALRKQLKDVDRNGFVKKKVLEEGGGKELDDECTVSFAFSAYWEGGDEPFDMRTLRKPLVVYLKDNNLLPGLQTAIKSMLVGELSLYLLSYKVMYGEMGIPPRIKPKEDCVFYIKLVKSVITPDERVLASSEANTFSRVQNEVKMLYSSGVALYKVNNYGGTIQLLRKGIHMLHNCRLADETEQIKQERLLIKFYINLAICYNKTKQPLKACTACNELHRLRSLWNNGKALFQNAKALRMIGQFDEAEKKIKKAIILSPDNKEIKAEYELLQNTQETCNQNKLLSEDVDRELLSDNFKREVDNLIKNFKNCTDLYNLTLPSKLNSCEIQYIKEVCIKENLFISSVQKSHSLDKDCREKDDNFLDPNDSSFN